MAILQFRRPHAAQKPASQPADWSQQELADFYRAHRLLSQNGVSIGIDRGVTDVGDPWMVFFDTGSEDVFLHVARFDGRCILVCETLGLKLTRPSLGELIVDLEGEIRQFITTRQERPSNVLLHPASRMILSLSAVFLLFKFEGGGSAQARGLAEPGNSVDAGRKTDVVAAARQHPALARLLDIVDAPAAAAAIAGAILSVEIARIHLMEDEASAKAGLVEHGQEAVAATDLSQLHGESGKAVGGDLLAEVNMLLATLSDADQKGAAHFTMIELNPETIQPAPAAVLAGFAAEQDIRTLFHDGATELAQDEPAVANAQAPAITTTAQTTTAPSVVVAGGETEIAGASSLATSTVKPLLSDTDLVQLSEDGGVSGLTATATGLGDISITNLGTLDTVVGLFQETALAGDTLSDLLVDMLRLFGSYEVEIANGQVLIEQVNVQTLSTELVGVWTNVMADGSAISMVGHADLMTSIASHIG